MGELLIMDIDGGLIAKWNADHPERSVKKYDRIIEVNGITEGVGRILQECGQSKLLRIVVKRRDARTAPSLFGRRVVVDEPSKHDGENVSGKEAIDIVWNDGMDDAQYFGKIEQFDEDEKWEI